MPWYARVKMVAAIARNFFKSSDRGSNPAAFTHALAFWAKRMSAGKGFMVAVAVAVVVMMFGPSETCFVFDVAQAASLTARCPGLSGKCPRGLPLRCPRRHVDGTVPLLEDFWSTVLRAEHSGIREKKGSVAIEESDPY